MFDILIHGERPDSRLVWDQTVLPLANTNRIRTITFLLPAHLVIYKKKYLKFSKQFQLHNSIKINYRYFLLPNRYYTRHVMIFKLAMIWTHFMLKISGERKMANMYCRGFLSGALALKLNKSFEYDPRSEYISEQITIGRLQNGSPMHHFLFDVEKRVLTAANNIVAVNEEHAAAMRSRVSKNLNISVKYFTLPNWKFIPPRECSFPDVINICYIGSLDLQYWNDAREYVRYLEALSNTVSINFTMYTLNPSSKVKATFRNLKNINIIFDKYDETDYYFKLSQQDIGIMFMPEMLDKKTRFGVKASEYLAASLPIICNTNVGALSQFIRAHKCGLVCSDPIEFEANMLTILNNYEVFSKKAHHTALAFFKSEV